MKTTTLLFCLTLCPFLSLQQALGQFSNVINLPPDPDIGDHQSIGSDTQLNLANGGMIGSFFSAGPGTNIEVNISGGSIDNYFRVNSGSVVNISGGTTGILDANSGGVVNFSGGSISRLNARSGSTVNISGGTIGDNLYFNGATVNIDGGTIGRGIQLHTGSKLNILAGSLGGNIYAYSGSQISISGGSIGDRLLSISGGLINISGGEFRLNGALIGGLETVGDTVSLNFPLTFVFSGTLEDGIPFAFSKSDGDYFGDGTITLTAASLPASYPALIALPGNSAPLGVRKNQTIMVNEGGALGDDFHAGLGSTTIISGGSIGSDFDTFRGSNVNISGGEFYLNGLPVGGLATAGSSLAFNVPNDSVLSGTLADGTPFAFSSLVGDTIQDNTLTLTAASLPSNSPTTISLPGVPAPQGIRDGQTVVVNSGGALGDHFNAGRGSTITVSGGQVGGKAEAVGSQVSISAGTIGNHFDAFIDTTVSISGGSIGEDFDAFAGSVVNISGGTVSSNFRAQRGSVVNISGGSVESHFLIKRGSVVNLSGGSVGDDFSFDINDITPSRRMLNISGADFRLNGEPIAGLAIPGDSMTLNVPFESLLSGTLADGTPFAFYSVSDHPEPGDYLHDGILTLSTTSLPAPDLIEINLPGAPAPLGVRDGQTLRVGAGGKVGNNFNAGRGGTVTIAGGEVGDNLEAVAAHIIISGGSIGDDFDAYEGSTVDIYGGQIGNNFHAHDGSTVNLFGTQFFLAGDPGGQDITSLLTENIPFPITDRSPMRIYGLLADGSPFSFDLESHSPYGPTFYPNALLTITLIPEPSSSMLMLIALGCLLRLRRSNRHLVGHLS